MEYGSILEDMFQFNYTMHSKALFQKTNEIINIILYHLDILLISFACIFPLIILGYFLFEEQHKAPIREDAVGYYAYLPAVFIYRDLSFKYMIDDSVPNSGGINTFERNLNPEEAKTLGFNLLPNSSYLDKYPVGVSFLLIPFYILGHVSSI